MLFGTLLASIALALSACAGAPRDRRAAPVRLSPRDAIPAEQRIYGQLGEPLVIPLTAAQQQHAAASDSPSPEWRPERMPSLTSAAGEPLNAELLFFRAGPPKADEASPWIPPAPAWTVEPWQATGGADWTPGPGLWALLVPPLRERAVIRLDGVALPIVWLPAPPATTDAPRAPRLDLPRPALRRLGEMLRPDLDDPNRQWRLSILTDRMRAMDLWPDSSAPALHPALAAYARQNELRWRAAIHALEQDDPVLAAEFVARLTAVVRTPSGWALPAWSLESPALWSIRDALLSPTGSARSRAAAVTDWLDHNPPAIAWVIDESAAGPAGASLATAGVANLTSRSAIASTAPLGEATRNAARAPAHASVSFVAPIPASVERSPPAIVARMDSWSATLAVLGSSLPVAPPGLMLGPLFPQWNMPAWLARRSPTARPDSACVALLQRSASDPEQWELYIEATGNFEGDTVTVWLGRFGTDRHTIRVGPGASESPPVDRVGDCWSALLPLPGTSIDESGRLFVALTRTGANGALWSWPRPMLPGQNEPGAAPIDLSSWGSLSAR